MRTRVVAAVLVLSSVVSVQPAGADHDGTRHGSRYRDAVVSTTGGVVASISDYASAAGIDVLDRGGNAIDAAVAMVFAVGVARPDMGGIGGGGFLVYRGANGRTAALDFRERSAGSPEFDADVLSGTGMHTDQDGKGSGHRVVGVPGVVAGMDEALRRLGSGRFGLGDLITNRDPASTTPYAHELARDGVKVTYDLAGSFFGQELRLQYYDETRRIYSFANPTAVYGMTLKQEDYAKSLALIARNGPDAFYADDTFPDPATGVQRDSIARLIAKNMASAEEEAKTNLVLQAKWPDGPKDTGYLTVEDFERYRAIWRDPLTTTYNGHEVITMPAPASGPANIETLNVLERFELASNRLDISQPANAQTSWDRTSANYLHVLAEARKLGLADHLAYVADPDHDYDYDGDGATDVMPIDVMTSKQYAADRKDLIDLRTAEAAYEPGVYSATTAVAADHGAHTNHLSVLDRDGNAVSVTTTIGHKFGSVVVAEGTGFLLNDELGDFDRAPGSPNAPGPRKRSRSSTSATIVVRDGKPILVAGGGGGGFIPPAVVEMIVNVVDYGLDIAHAIDAERLAPFRTDTGKPGLYLESSRDEAAREAGLPESSDQRVPDAVLADLKTRGHVVRPIPDESQRPAGYANFGSTLEAVGFNLDTDHPEAISDPRSEHDDFDVTGCTFGQGAMAQGQEPEDVPDGPMPEPEVSDPSAC